MNPIKNFIQNFRSKDIPAVLVVGMDDETHGIGFEGMIPWREKDDMKFFKDTTVGKVRFDGNYNTIVCGGNTYVSFGEKNLPNRHLIVVSKTMYDKYKPELSRRVIQTDSCIVDYDPKSRLYTAYIKDINSVSLAFRAIEVESRYYYGTLFVIGGSMIYDEFMKGKVRNVYIKTAFVTHIVFNDTVANSLKDKSRDVPVFIKQYGHKYDTFFSYFMLTVKNRFKIVKRIPLGKHYITRHEFNMFASKRLQDYTQYKI